MSSKTYGSVTRYGIDLHSPDATLREEAARQIWLRFAVRLQALVERRLDRRLRRRAGSQDVLQSLFASFFAATPGANGPPQSRTDLWRLLIHFAVCKMVNVADHHFAARRDVRREETMESDPDAFEQLSRVSPADEVLARCEFEELLASLPEDLQEVLALRLEGHTNAEIARRIDRSERTVELKLARIRDRIGNRIKDALSQDPS